MRVAGDPVQANNGVFYLLADHLGSTNVVVDEDGDRVGELRYRAWGETRYASGSPDTDYRYTGQREEAGIGLYYYHARWYDPILGRFAHADTIIPFGQSPIARDRYAYASDNPLRFVDPSGHMIDWGRNEGFDWNPAQEAAYQHYVALESREPGEAGRWTAKDTKKAATSVLVFTAGVATATVAVEVITPFAIETLPGAVSTIYSDLLWEAAGACATSYLCWSIIGASGPNISSSPHLNSNEIGDWGVSQAADQLPLTRGQFRQVGPSEEIRYLDAEFANAPGHFAEIKSSLRDTIYATERIRGQIAFDAKMANTPLWIFVHATPSRPLIRLLADMQIPWTQLHVPLP
jgi:RHS repeat-associated protein